MKKHEKGNSIKTILTPNLHRLEDFNMGHRLKQMKAKYIDPLLQGMGGSREQHPLPRKILYLV